MRCPFLKEVEVRFCEIAPVRKMIPRSACTAQMERCSSSAYVDCAVMADRPERRSGAGRCPFLRESWVQYCEAVPAQRFIPYSEALSASCQGERHAYCEAFLSLARAGTQPLPVSDGGVSRPRQRGGRAGVGPDEADTPARLAFAANHLWIDLESDDTWHVGIDSFLARVLGEVTRVSFPVARGLCRPTVVLTIDTVGVPLVFPRRMLLGAVNVALRVHPDRLVADPFGRGWLFEGVLPGDVTGEARRALLAGLIPDAEAASWMRREADRLATWVGDLASRSRAPSPLVEHGIDLAGSGIAQQIDAEDLVTLFHEFFSPERETTAA